MAILSTSTWKQQHTYMSSSYRSICENLSFFSRFLWASHKTHLKVWLGNPCRFFSAEQTKLSQIWDYHRPNIGA